MPSVPWTAPSAPISNQESISDLLPDPSSQITIELNLGMGPLRILDHSLGDSPQIDVRMRTVICC